MYFGDYFESSRNVLVSKKIENEFFTAEISITNPNRGYGVAPNDELIYYAIYDIKSEDVELLNPIIEIKFREKPIKSFELTDWMMTQDGLRLYHEPILIDDLGYTVITYSTEYHIPKSFVTVEHERKVVVVKTISELQQEKIEKISNNAFIVTAIIGSITAIAILGTVFIAKNNSRLLEEQKNIMRESSENQIALSNIENQISKKHIEFLAMLEIMKIFNDDINAKKRDTLYKKFRTNSLYNDDGSFQGTDLAIYAASVRGTYDQMGKLVKDGYVLKDQFLPMYCGSVIRMFKVFKKHIEYEQRQRESKHLAYYFEWIFNESRNYWKTNFPDEPEPEPF